MSAFDDAVAIFLASYGGFDRQTIVDGLPKTVTDPFGGEVPIPHYFGAAQPVSFVGGSAMPYPTVLSGGNAYKMTFFMNAGIHGWSESVRWYVVGSEQPMVKLFALAALIAQKRKPWLHVDANLVAIRVTEDKRGGASRVKKTTEDGCGAGAYSGVLDQVSNCIYLRGLDATGTVRETTYHHGFSSGFLLLGGEAQNGQVVTNKNMRDFLTDMKAAIVREYSSYGGTAVPCIKTYQRDPAANPVAEVKTFGIDDNGFLTVTMDGDPFLPLAAGTPLAVRASRTTGVRRISGRTKVIGNDMVDGDRIYTLAKRPTCLPGALVGLTGEAQRLGPQWVRLTELEIGGTGDHQVGRPFGYTPGRRSSR